MDGFDATLRQLADHGERLALIDAREAEHFAAVGERLTELGTLVTGLGSAVRDQAAVLAALQGLDEQVTTLTTRLAGILPSDGDGDGQGDGEVGLYRPCPAPRWWKLHGPAREQALGRVAGWVEQVYRPGYGQLAATLSPCWGEHPLCLYALDIACELWSVLYLRATRTPAVLSAQAEFQTRILPALAGQMLGETQRCGHAQHRATGNGAATGRRP